MTTTLLGLGAVDETHPLCLRMLGMHGSAAANYAVQECDLLVAIGARFEDRVTGRIEGFAPHARIVHIDADPSSISKNVVVDLPVVGDARDVLGKMLPLIEAPDRTPWLERIAQLRRDFPFHYDPPAGRIRPQQVCQRLGELTGHDAIVATGVGQHQMWAAQFYGFRRPRQILTSGGLGTMGFGVPAAIGAAVGNPGRTVIDIDGDGSFSMTMAEIITAVEQGLAVKFIVLHNGYLGMVRQWQELFYDRRYSGVTNPRPDFAAIARAFGAHGATVQDPAELDDALAETLACEGPAVLVAAVEPEENVYPMVPAGQALHEMKLGKLA